MKKLSAVSIESLSIKLKKTLTTAGWATTLEKYDGRWEPFYCLAVFFKDEIIDVIPAKSKSPDIAAYFSTKTDEKYKDVDFSHVGFNAEFDFPEASTFTQDDFKNMLFLGIGPRMLNYLDKSVEDFSIIE